MVFFTFFQLIFFFCHLFKFFQIQLRSLLCFLILRRPWVDLKLSDRTVFRIKYVRMTICFHFDEIKLFISLRRLIGDEFNSQNLFYHFGILLAVDTVVDFRLFYVNLFSLFLSISLSLYLSFCVSLSLSLSLPLFLSLSFSLSLFLFLSLIISLYT